MNEEVKATETNDQPVELTKKQKFVKEAKSLSIILLCVLIFRSVFFEPFRIPSGSMIPTLMIGDFILVSKFSYGFKVPFSDFSFGGINLNPIYLFGESEPKRGDVVVFKYPKEPDVNYIKRVVGLPGDEIKIVNKVVYINNEPIQTVAVDGKAIMEDMDDKFKEYDLEFLEAQTGEAKHYIQQDLGSSYKVDFEPMRIPEKSYFVMGDNRDFSYDSRFWGFVPHENIKGRALFVWFSLIIPGGENPFKFRPWRIGTAIN
jgi:signal peptidase I